MIFLDRGIAILKRKLTNLQIRACSNVNVAAAFLLFIFFFFVVVASSCMTSRPPPTKKSKRGANAPRVSASERVKKFSEHPYTDGGVLFCKFCNHSMNHV